MGILEGINVLIPLRVTRLFVPITNTMTATPVISLNPSQGHPPLRTFGQGIEGDRFARS